MTKFNVHFEYEGEKHSKGVDAATTDAAANAIRRNFPGAIVTKVKVDRSIDVNVDVPTRGFKVFVHTHRQELVPQSDMIGVDAAGNAYAVNIVSGRNVDVHIDECNWLTPGDITGKYE